MTISSSIRMNDNNDIPILGLGTYQSVPGKETRNAVEYALDIGYRHIDTAAMYNNEEDVGKAISASSVDREQVFVTTKLWNSDHGYDAAMKAFEDSLRRLGTSYIDLYLIHWPVEDIRRDTWRALETIVQSDYCRSVGVSNYTIRHLQEMTEYAEIMPAVNQVEFSPYLNQKELLDFCSRNKIVLEAYTPLVRGRKLDDPALAAIAEKYNKTSAQILIRWAVQTGTVVLPKSVNFHRIKQNAEIYDFEISSEDMNLLNDFHEDYRVAWDPSNIR